MNSDYNEDYFERGTKTKKSTYINYRWLPELTIPLAHEIIIQCRITREDKILDFGCAKGFLVLALRLLHYETYGIEISDYAINTAPPHIKKYIKKVDNLITLEDYLDHMRFNWIIAKDVFEHLDKDYLNSVLKIMYNYIANMYVIVPLGKDGVYNAHKNNTDPTHKICENVDWWISQFNKAGYTTTYYTTKMKYIKQDYVGIHEAHGFFKLKAL